MGAAISEQDFVGLGECLDSLGDVDGDAANVVAVQLDLAGMQPATHVDADGADRVADGTVPARAWGSSPPSDTKFVARCWID